MMQRILTAFLILASTAAWSQGILSRKGLGSLSIDPLTQMDMQQRASKLETLNVNDVRAAELLKKKAVSDNEFQKLRSRLPQSVLKDSMDVMAYVKRSIFRDTLIYGSELFSKDSKLDFAPNLQIAASPNYQVGPGDELELVLYGAQEATYSLQIATSGSVNVPYAGVVQASGLSLAALESKIRQRLTEHGYKALASGVTKLKLIVSEVRSIQVHVVGGREPGTYTVPAIATPMHLLYESGGPGELGSYREIELIRGGKVIGNLDLYAFMRTGSLGTQEGLRDGDIVRIPVYRNRINLMGEFKRPGLYELLEGENLAQAIDFAGGFTEGGFRGQVLIFRVGEQELSVADVMAKDYATAPVREGDVVVANPLRNRYENRVAVTGGVVRPGYYAWTPGMNSDDLVARAQGLDRAVSRTKAVLVRRPEGQNGRYLEFLIGQERQELMANDSMYIPSYTDLAVFDSVQVRGFVNRAGNFVYYEGLTLEQAVLLAGGIKSNANVASAEVTVPRLNSKGEFTGQQTVTQVELNWSSAGTMLTPGATVSIRKRKNLNTSKLVHVRGAVSVEGGYSLMDYGEPINSLMTRIGPLPKNALTAFAIVVRKGPERQIFQPMDRLELRSIWIKTQDTIAINLTNARQRKRILLLDGDTLIIPALTNTVLVHGAVKNEGGHSLVPGKRAKYYIKNCGGYATEAVRRSTVVIYANGRSAEVRYFAGLLPVYPRVYSNSEVIVNYKPEDREKTDPAQVAAISSIMTSLSSLALGLFFLLRN